MKAGISIVIPTWNGLELLRENLPSIEAAAASYSRRQAAETEIVVVDDGSTDATCRLLPLEFPNVRLVSKSRNEGFSKTCNIGFEACRFPLVSLINNDVRVEEDYLWFHALHFSDPNVFGVTAKVFEWDAPVFATGGRVGRFRRGFWSGYFNYDLKNDSAWVEQRRLLSFYAIGGFATYDREKLALLNGFSEVLSPFHWEDADLSYRAWKRGWEVRYEPRSVCHHRISSTIDAHYAKRAVEVVAVRNRLLFHWINLHSWDFLARHLLVLAFLLPLRVLTLDFDFHRSFFHAVKRLPAALRLRRQEKGRAVRSDRQLAETLRAFYKAAPIRVYYNRSQALAEYQSRRAD